MLLAAAAVGGGAWVEASLHRDTILDLSADRPPPAPGTTWLLVGSDSRRGLTAQERAELTTGDDVGDGRTDTILVVHTPHVGSEAPTTMVSLPRDSYVPIPGYGWDKINTASAVGGPSLLVETVEQITGLRLDHYAEIGFTGFAGLVDALGGVSACPAEPIDDPLAGIDLPAGCQRLDGPDALGFVRSRATPSADLDRMDNQRLFVTALLDRVTDPAVWLNPWRWYHTGRAAVDALTVDVGDHLWDLARLAWALHRPTTTMTVPIAEFTGNDSGSVVVWDHDAAGELFEALAADASVPPTALGGTVP